MKLRKLFKMAMSSIWSNKIRSFLTMLGIIIGISSVIILVGIGEGTKKDITDKIEALGTNLLTVNITGNRTNLITDEELDEIKGMTGVKEIAPAISQGNINVKAGTKVSTTNLEASTSNYADIRKIEVESGRFINDMDITNLFNVLVIGPETANTLFATNDVVGNKMYVNGIEFTIVGVLKAQGTTAAGSSDDKIILPLTTAQRLLKTTSVKSFYISADSKEDVNIAKSFVQSFLDKKYNYATNSYKIFDQTSLIEASTASTDTMTKMLGGIAAISLLVGGIGIMNIMLVSVIERTREIGIRKAIGAKRKTILLQFLIEAVTLSSIGGLIGVAIGFIGGVIAKSVWNFNVIISTSVVIDVFIFSLLIGVIFGMYPANKASKLNPIDAVRFE